MIWEKVADFAAGPMDAVASKALRLPFYPEETRRQFMFDQFCQIYAESASHYQRSRCRELETATADFRSVARNQHAPEEGRRAAARQQRAMFYCEPW